MNTTRLALLSILAQTERYFTACHTRNNYLEATENAISQRLIPKVEELIMEEMRYGYIHAMEYMNPNKVNGQKVLMTDLGVFSNYQGAVTGLINSLYTLNGRYDLKTEGMKLLQMIIDLETMHTTGIFHRKYPSTSDFVRYNGLNELLSSIGSMLTVDNFICTQRNDEFYEGRIESAEVVTTLFRFFSANPKHYDAWIPSPVGIMGKNLVWEKTTANRTYLFIKGKRNEHEGRFEGDFFVQGIDAVADFGHYKRMWDYWLTEEEGMRLGRTLTKLYPFCRKD